MKCPNCQSENVQEQKDGKLLCIECDTSFKIEKDGAKVAKTDVIEILDKRVTALEEKKSASQPQKDTPEKPAEIEPDQPIQQGDDQDEGTADNLFDE